MPLNQLQRKAFRELATDLEGVDLGIYRRFDKDPLEPIIGLGRPDLPVGFFGRDPGRDEVRHGEPFIGAGGQLVRKTLYQYVHGKPMPDFDASLAIGRSFFWANTVPYKPIGNKAWPMKTKRRFQSLMATLLIEQWQGRSLITLGREAFLWFGIGQTRADRDRIDAFWQSSDRFEGSINIKLTTPDDRTRSFALYPLPHPSPLNATWYKHFPRLLTQRLEQLEVERLC
jgi:uracil-DNA glycosylase